MEFSSDLELWHFLEEQNVDTKSWYDPVTCLFYEMADGDFHIDIVDGKVSTIYNHVQVRCYTFKEGKKYLLQEEKSVYGNKFVSISSSEYLRSNMKKGQTAIQVLHNILGELGITKFSVESKETKTTKGPNSNYCTLDCILNIHHFEVCVDQSDFKGEYVVKNYKTVYYGWK